MSTCKDCRYYAVGTSECRRHAPVLLSGAKPPTSGVAIGFWPHTEPGLSCGDHQPVQLTGGLLGHLKPSMMLTREVTAQ